MKLKEMFQIAIYLMIFIAILAEVFNWSQNTIDTLFNWIIVMLLSIVMSAIVGFLIERFSGDTFKKINKIETFINNLAIIKII